MSPHSTPPRTLALELPLSPAYSDEAAQLTSQTVSATLDLSGGPRTFRSDARTVGAFGDIEVRAQLSFDYDYSREENKLTIRGNDDRTDAQLTITSYLSGRSDQTLAQAPRVLFHSKPNDAGQNQALLNVWADHIGRRPALGAAFAAAARDCNQAIVNEAIAAGVSAVLQIGTPPVVTLENLDEFKRMFGEPPTLASAGDRLADLVRMQFKLNSVYVGTVTWATDFQFANVIGSTDDPKVPSFSSWIKLWRDKCNSGVDNTQCASQGFFGGPANDKKCNTDYKGGHVITGQTAKRMDPGSTVYIFPICGTHNSNDGYYMESKNYHTGVQLRYWDTRSSAAPLSALSF